MDQPARGDDLAEIYHTGARNLHALELTAIEMIERQLGRLESYPEMTQKLRQHLEESKRQAERLEHILGRRGQSTSSAKNAASSVLGNVAAALHATASDEVLKDTFANYAFEHQEIAAYTSLISMAGIVGDAEAAPLLRQSLAEEEAMASWIRDHVVPTTERYMSLSQAGRQAAV